MRSILWLLPLLVSATTAPEDGIVRLLRGLKNDLMDAFSKKDKIYKEVNCASQTAAADAKDTKDANNQQIEDLEAEKIKATALSNENTEDLEGKMKTMRPKLEELKNAVLKADAMCGSAAAARDNAVSELKDSWSINVSLMQHKVGTPTEKLYATGKDMMFQARKKGMMQLLEPEFKHLMSFAQGPNGEAVKAIPGIVDSDATVTEKLKKITSLMSMKMATTAKSDGMSCSGAVRKGQNKLAGFESDYAEMEAAKAEKDVEISKGAARVTQIEQEIADLQKDTTDANTAASAAKKQLDGIASDHGKAAENLELQRAGIDAAISSLNKSLGGFLQLNQEPTDRSSKFGKDGSQVTRVKSVMADMKNQIKDVEDTIKEKRDAVDSCQADIHDQYKSLLQSAVNIDNLMSSLQENSDESASTDKSKKASERRKEKIQNEKSAFEEDFNQQNDAADAVISKLETSATNIDTAITEVKSIFGSGDTKDAAGSGIVAMLVEEKDKLNAEANQNGDTKTQLKTEYDAQKGRLDTRQEKTESMISQRESEIDSIETDTTEKMNTVSGADTSDDSVAKWKADNKKYDQDSQECILKASNIKREAEEAQSEISAITNAVRYFDKWIGDMQ